jgi:hypothetical protein
MSIATKFKEALFVVIFAAAGLFAVESRKVPRFRTFPKFPDRGSTR